MPIMGLRMADLVQEVCHAGGAGALVLDGAEAGYRTFDDAVGRGVEFPYVIFGVEYPAEWESGVGVLDGTGRLVRDPAASSAGAGVAVTFMPGEKMVVLTPHADWLAAVEDHGHATGEIAGLTAALAGKQGASAVLDTLAALAPAADRLAYWTGAGAAALTPVSAAGRGLIGDADATAMRSRLGLVIGSDVQAQDSDLAAIAALTTSGFGRGVLTQGDGAAMRAYIGAGTSSTTGTVTSVAGSGGTTGLTLSGGPVTGAGTLTLGGTLGVGHGGTGATSAAGARTALGLGTIAAQDAGSVGITGGAIDGTPIGATYRGSGSFTDLHVTNDYEAGSYGKAAETIMKVMAAGGHDALLKLMEAADSYGFTIRNASGSGLKFIRHSGNTGGVLALFLSRDTGNIGIGTSGDGGGSGVLMLANGVAPSAAVAGAVQIYSEGGALKCRGGSGTVTTLASA